MPRIVSLTACAAVLALSFVARAEPPRLVVLLVVDQLSAAQLDRAEELLGEDGFRRLLAEGAVARDARYHGTPTFTAHGHATLSTGTYAARHGIVGNDWWDRALGSVAYLGHDPRFRLLTRDELLPKDGTAPTQLRAPTFADALRWSHPAARVVSVSLKDRGSILLGGAKPDAAVWFDQRTDRWTSSTYYAESLPRWVPREPVSTGADEWRRLDSPRLCRLLPAPLRPAEPAECARVLYERRAGPDDDPAERGDLLGTTFPHRLPPLEDPRRGRAFAYTPLADEALFRLAALALQHEELGRDEVPDLLTVSASAFDLLGHVFGPESQESLDALLRLDRAVAAFLRELDARVGRGRYVLGFSADHGVQPSPARAARERLHAGVISEAVVAERGRAALEKAGIGKGQRGEVLSPFVNIGLSLRGIPLAGPERARAEEVLVAELSTLEGVAAVLPRSLFESHLALRGDAAMYARSWFDGRSAELIVVPRPLWITHPITASHGTPYLADTRVPFVLYRAGKPPMSLDGIVDVASLTPTLALIAGSAPPAAADAPILTRVVDALR